MKKLLSIQIFVFIIFIIVVALSHMMGNQRHWLNNYENSNPYPNNQACPPGLSFDEISRNCIDQEQYNKDAAVTENTDPKNTEVKVYAEKDKTGDLILGAGGEQMIIVASTNVPATINFNIKFKTSGVYPGAKEVESNYSGTVSVDSGKTIIDTLNAIGGKVDIKYTYIDNSKKTTSQINPPVKNNTELSLEGIVYSPDDLFNTDIRYFELVSRSTTEKKVTYTLTYTPKDNSSQQKVITKTILVPMGRKVLESIKTIGEADLKYDVK